MYVHNFFYSNTETCVAWYNFTLKNCEKKMCEINENLKGFTFLALSCTWNEHNTMFATISQFIYVFVHNDLAYIKFVALGFYFFWHSNHVCVASWPDWIESFGSWQSVLPKFQHVQIFRIIHELVLNYTLRMLKSKRMKSSKNLHLTMPNHLNIFGCEHLHAHVNFTWIYK